ncbi:MAG: hypothetical protein ACJ8DJ_10860, partial [Gemmatimonadales bacterium]
ALVALGFALWLLRRRRPLTGGQVLLVAATATMVVPLLLPEMHERYFYLAEVLLVLAIAVEGRMLVPAVTVQAASTITYASYLRGADLMPLEATAVLGLAAGIAAATVLVLHVRRADRQPEVAGESVPRLRQPSHPAGPQAAPAGR